MGADEIDLTLLRESFQIESLELLSGLEDALLSLEQRPGDESEVETIFRAAHTIKGNAQMVGFEYIALFTHVFEDLLEGLRRRTVLPDRKLVTLLLRAVDALRRMISEALDEGGGLLPEEEALFEELREKVPDRPKGEVPEGASPTGGAAEAEVREALLPNRCGSKKTLRVGTDKLDRVMDLVGEIAIARGRVTEMLENEEGYNKREILEAQRESDLLYMDLQEQVMKMRMVPVGPLFREHVRTVRDISTSLGKAVRLVVEGDDVEVDMTVVEHLRDPLTHLVRNAVSHGIESPEGRAAAGKTPVGRIILRARHDSGSIVIRIIDDGAGLPREKVLARAREMGLVGEEDAPEDRELFKLIFEPGFSTAEAIDELSGRGVGMDVVRRNVEALRGTVDVESRPGEGTTVAMRLPLTLAIIEGFRVGVGDETYVVPLESVVECVELPEDHKERVDGRGVAKLRDKPVPFLDLRDTFGLGGAAPVRENVIIVRHDGRAAGLAVDRLYGGAQTVIKPLNRVFQGIPGLSGTAIMGNGRVAFVLDVPGLLKKALEREAANLEG